MIYVWSGHLLSLAIKWVYTTTMQTSTLQRAKVSKVHFLSSAVSFNGIVKNIINMYYDHQSCFVFHIITRTHNKLFQPSKSACSLCRISVWTEQFLFFQTSQKATPGARKVEEKKEKQLPTCWKTSQSKNIAKFWRHFSQWCCIKLSITCWQDVSKLGHNQQQKTETTRKV